MSRVRGFGACLHEMHTGCLATPALCFFEHMARGRVSARVHGARLLRCGEVCTDMYTPGPGRWPTSPPSLSPSTHQFPHDADEAAGLLHHPRRQQLGQQAQGGALALEHYALLLWHDAQQDQQQCGSGGTVKHIPAGLRRCTWERNRSQLLLVPLFLPGMTRDATHHSLLHVHS